MRKNDVVIYARYSSDNQRTESVTTQLAICKRWCAERGFSVVHEYADEALTGTNDRRPQFQQLIADSARGLFSGVVVYCLSRFSRSVRDTLTYIDELSRHGVRLHSVIEQVDPDTPEGELFQHMSMGINQWHSSNMRREVMRGHLENAREGKANGGKAPLGYVTDPKTLKFLVDEPNAESVRLVFARFVEGCSYVEIARELNALGKLTTRGTPFVGCFIDTLRKRHYLGERVYNRVEKKSKMGRRNWRKSKPESEIVRVPGAHVAIVDEDTFAEANRILDQRKLGRKSPRRYLLSSLVRCGVCGFPMCGQTKSDRRTPALTLSYRCNSRRKKLATCQTRDLNMAAIDGWVLEWLRQNLLAEGRETETAEHINAKLAAEASGRLAEIRAEVSKLDEAIDNLVQALASATGGAHGVLTKEIDRLTDERAPLLRTIYAEEQRGLPESVTPEGVAEAVRKYGPLLDSPETAKAREAVLAFVSGIRADNEKITMTVRLNPFLGSPCKQEVAYEVAGNRDKIAPDGRRK